MRKICATLPILLGGVKALGKLWGDVKPRSFDKGNKLDIHVSRLWSAVAAPMPYDFYTLNWCDSTAGHSWDGGYNRKFKNHYSHNDLATENLHESPYTFEIGKADGSQVVCKKLLKTED